MLCRSRCHPEGCVCTHSSTHLLLLLTFFSSDIFPLQKVIILGCQTGKRRPRPPSSSHRPPPPPTTTTTGDGKTAPRCDARSEHVHRRAAECSHCWCRRRVRSKTSFSSRGIGSPRCCEALPITDASVRPHPTPFSQSRSFRLPDRADRHINDAESGKPLNSARKFSTAEFNAHTIGFKNNNEVMHFSSFIPTGNFIFLPQLFFFFISLPRFRVKKKKRDSICWPAWNRSVMWGIPTAKRAVFEICCINVQ